MKIKKVVLNNFGPHKHLEINDINKAVVSIIGLNGSGKSHVLDAIRFAFTGDLPQKIDSYITEGEKSLNVFVEFEKGGIVGTIERKATSSTSSRKLTWGNDTPITAASAVDKRFEQILGADKQTVLNSVFIEQGSIVNLLSDSATQRIDIFSKLLNLHYINKRVRNIDEYISKLKSGVKDLGPLKDQIKAEKDKVLEDINISKNNLEELFKKVSSKDAIESFLNCVSDYELNIKLCEDAERDLETSKQDLSNETEYKDAVEYLQTCKDTLEKYKEDAETIKTNIASAKNYEQTLSLVKKFMEDQKYYFDTMNELERLNKLFGIDGASIPASVIEEKFEASEKIASNDNSATFYETKIQEIIPALENANKEVDRLKKLVESYESDIADTNRDLNMNNNVLSNLTNLLAMRRQLKSKMDGNTVSCPSCGLKLVLGQTITDESLQELETQIAFFKEGKETCEKSILELTSLKNTSALQLSDARGDIRRLESNNTEYTDTAKKLREESSKLIEQFFGKHEEYLRWYNDITKIDVNTYVNLVTFALPNIQTKSYPGKFPEGYLGEVKVENDVYTINPKDLESVDESKLSKLYKDYQTASDGMDKITSKIFTIEHLQEDIKKKSKTLSDIQKKLSTHPVKSELAKLATTLPVNGGNLDEVKTYMKGLLEACIEETTILNNHKTTLNNIQLREADIAKMENENLNKYNAISELDSIKYLLTPKTGITKDYLNYLFKIIVSYVSEYLSNMDSNFVIDVEDREGYEDLSFKFKRLDKSNSGWLPMNKLSGGQQVKLSIAFLIAIQKIICPELCFLVLDEPSTHLDTPSIIALKDMLRSMNETMQEGEGQIWIVDHSQELKDDPVLDFNPDQE